MALNILQTVFGAVQLMATPAYDDVLGCYCQTYHLSDFQQAGIEVDFVQENQSFSKSAGTLRGLHYQETPFAQTKLIRVLTGAIYDVAVDIRPGSETFGRWTSFVLSDRNHYQLLIPKGFAHGFLTLSDNVAVAYKVDTYCQPHAERGLAYNDFELGIVWPMPESQLVLSEKDQAQPGLAAVKQTLIGGF